METVAVPTFGDFASHLGSAFEASNSDSPGCDFVLVEANDLSSDDQFHSFSLLFRAPLTARPEQAVFSLKNGQIGPVDVFLVPVKQTDEGLFFEANFSVAR